MRHVVMTFARNTDMMFIFCQRYVFRISILPFNFSVLKEDNREPFFEMMWNDSLC